MTYFTCTSKQHVNVVNKTDLEVIQEDVIAQAEETEAAVPADNCNNSNCTSMNINICTECSCV